jgi:hypothetical protein
MIAIICTKGALNLFNRINQRLIEIAAFLKRLLIDEESDNGV